MKKIFLKSVFLLSVSALSVSCTKEDDFDIPTVINPFFKEDFQTAVDNTDLDILGWTNFAEAGTKKWKEEVFDGNGYAEFSAYNSGSAINKAWLISPVVNMDTFANERLTFRVAQHHLDVDSPDNSLQVLISTDYDGTNVTAATWTALNANIPTKSASWYEFATSVIDLSSYTGNVHIAFKFTGSGTNTTLDGAFQVDNVFIYNEK
ncbi:DUF5017 domain-containing protein [Flavobacterium sp. SM15]|uniref:DUF5017 domain-containing protein n=1 Tax=Flavobacterium sp. SM15 TaxID=2908005 RepID=UPI001EDB7866|nr:DUF5017 domain-containing protein [Flavobacterium sp. SM15]MCG2612305.1 DUF5017 domain-containing protein [Flavobacterium sp. SM15]